MKNKRKLSSEDRQFFEAVQQSAFINPFTDARREADMRVLGVATGEWDEALQGLLTELEQRLKRLTVSTGVCAQGSFETEADQELVTAGILFSLFHRHRPDFDALIRRQGEAGDAVCEAPFAVGLFEKLVQHGFSRTEAEQYIAIFYQMRRAFYFISNSLVGESPCMKQLRKRLWDNIFTHDMRWYVRGLWNRMEDFSTLLLGETGTGKGAVAAALGRSGFIPFLSGKRAFAESFTRAFVAINLSQFSETLIESELFGHRKGAFTGAVERHEGVFARCSPHGAIFLDEIGDASEPIQIKLLQVLQQRTFSPVGSHEVCRFKGRVIAATNRELGTLRREGTFRDDFFYRLCSDQIEVPTLRLRLQESPHELEMLIRHILSRLGGDVESITLTAVLGALEKGVGCDYAWPGNVRELEQAVRCILLTGEYRGDTNMTAGEDVWLSAFERGELSAQQLSAGYCQRLFKRYGSYGEVARRTGLDWRTVKKNVNNHVKTAPYSCLLGTILMSAGWGYSDPKLEGASPFNRHYQATDYQEPYRPQFHFSPQNGWMNDINALWYLDGKYHMLYQWGKNNRDGGYASTDDLLHWNDHGLALIGKNSHARSSGAKQNVSGEQVYSGSGIVVSGPVAAKITGSTNSALIAFYTGTKVGTCIAWSNNKGKTWNNYDKNPVANPTRGAVPRDPCVIWHEPTKKWVMAIYEQGTTFYESKDLINWAKISNIKFGFECPDLVELPLNGDPNNMKWVIYDAAGQYLVGHFDGTRFIDENQSTESLFMDVGPDFYAGQCFFPYTLPQKKYIQLAWMDEWNGGIGEEPWERNATFPVELGLVTRDGKMRVTRSPIAAIEALYNGTPVRIGQREVGADNILTGVRAKTFDMTLTFDLKGATAEKVVFQIANVSYQYDIAGQKIIYQGVEKNKFGDKQSPVLRPDSNQLLTIRMLVDWSSIEIFSDGGVFSLSQQVAFDPKDDSLNLTAIGGNVKLVNLELHPIKSIWR